MADNIDITLICPGIVVTDFLKNRAAGDKHANPPGMSTERCVALMLAGIANGLSEVWAAQNPMLALIYLATYLPDVHRVVFGYVLRTMPAYKNIGKTDWEQAAAKLFA